MKLLILSDLHCEISEFEPIKTDADVVVLAGDIGSGTNGVEWAMEAFIDKPIIYVPGNHEFYHRNRSLNLGSMRYLAAGSNLHLLDNNEVVIDGVRFLGSTLWTDFKLFGDEEQKFALMDAQRYLQDFNLISEGPLRFTPQNSIDLHERSVKWLKDRLDEDHDGKTVVVTHHLPSMLSVSDRFKGSLLSACFASNLDDLFGKDIDVWVHGHTHDTIDYVVNGTRVVCNPRGYVTYSGIENFDFNPTFVIEV